VKCKISLPIRVFINSLRFPCLLAFIMHLHRKHSSLCTMMWIGGEPGGAHVNTKCTLMYEVQHKHGRLLSQSVMISEVPSHMHSSQLQTLIILTVKLIVEYIMLRVFLFQKKNYWSQMVACLNINIHRTQGWSSKWKVLNVSAQLWLIWSLTLGITFIFTQM
jgi:hypothetical protein